MARDEVGGGRKKRDPSHGATGGKMTRQRARDRESATGRAGGTGDFIEREDEDAPRKTPGTSGDKKQLDEGGI
jgi:hypothetical protein